MKKLLIFCIASMLETAVLFAGTVTNANDSGPGSLRQANAVSGDITNLAVTGNEPKGERPAVPLVASSACTGNRWAGATPYPTTISHYGFAQVGQDFYVIAGASDGATVNTVRRYRVGTNAWTQLASFPSAGGEITPAAAHYAGKIYVMDGYDTNFPKLIRIYDIATNTWTNGPERPGSLTSGAAVGAFNGKVYVVGAHVPSSTTSIYNIASNNWSAGPGAPAPYHQGGYTQIGQFLYLIGTLNNPTNFTASMRLDMATNTWSLGPPWKPQRADFALAAAGARLYAIGGDLNGSGDATSTLVNELDTSAWPGGAWLPSPLNLPSPRRGNQAGFFSTGRAGGEIWSTGGQTSLSSAKNEHLYRVLECPVNYTTTGSITASDATQTGRITRNGIASDCNGKAYPGTNDAISARHYDQYQFTNTNAAAACVQVTLTSTVSGIHSVAYLGGFAPANIQTNYIGDLGVIFSANKTSSYSFSVPAGANFSVIVHETTSPTPANTYTLSVGCTAAMASASFSNPSPIAMPLGGAVSPYPSNITVSGLSGGIAAAPGSVKVTLHGFSHTETEELGMLLVGPTGAAFEFLSGPTGYLHSASDITFSISDSGATPLPDNSPLADGALYRPAVYVDGTYGPPAPGSFSQAAPAATATFSSTFAGTDPNGTWSLYVADSNTFGGGSGSIASGWSLEIATNPSPVPLSAVSRKIHGGIPFDVPLPLTGTLGVECRSGGAGGDHQVRITFSSPVTVGGVCVTSSDGMATATKSVSSAVVTVDLQDVTNAQTLAIKLTEVSDGVYTGDVEFQIGMLAGDTTGNGSVNASDVSQTKSKSGQAVSASTFRADVTVSNSINASDVSYVKSKSGTALP